MFKEEIGTVDKSKSFTEVMQKKRKRKEFIFEVRDYVDVCIDKMEDYDFVQGEITNLVSTDVRLRVDEQLLLGTGVYPELNSVSSTASTFAAGSYASSVSAATIIDLILLPTDMLVLDNLKKKKRLQDLTMGELNEVLNDDDKELIDVR